MKHLLITSGLFALICMVACKKNNNNPPIVANLQAFTIDTVTGTTEAIIITSPVPWQINVVSINDTINHNAAWVHVDTNSGGSGATTVRVTTQSPGNVALPRKALILISPINGYGATPYSVAVTQEP